MPLPTGLPTEVTDPFVAAQAARITLSTADATVTDLTTKLTQAQTDEGTAKQAARDTLKAAEAAFDNYVTTTRAALEAVVNEDPTP